MKDLDTKFVEKLAEQEEGQSQGRHRAGRGVLAVGSARVSPVVQCREWGPFERLLRQCCLCVAGANSQVPRGDRRAAGGLGRRAGQGGLRLRRRGGGCEHRGGHQGEERLASYGAHHVSILA